MLHRSRRLLVIISLLLAVAIGLQLHQEEDHPRVGGNEAASEPAQSLPQEVAAQPADESDETEQIGIHLIRLPRDHPILMRSPSTFLLDTTGSEDRAGKRDRHVAIGAENSGPATAGPSAIRYRGLRYPPISFTHASRNTRVAAPIPHSATRLRPDPAP